MLKRLLFIATLAIACQLQAECVTSGLFDELCTKVEDADPCKFSTIFYKAEFQCYRKFGICEAQNDSCAWQQNQELTECINEYREKLVLMDTFGD